MSIEYDVGFPSLLGYLIVSVLYTSLLPISIPSYSPIEEPYIFPSSEVLTPVSYLYTNIDLSSLSSLLVFASLSMTFRICLVNSSLLSLYRRGYPLYLLISPYLSLLLSSTISELSIPLT